MAGHWHVEHFRATALVPDVSADRNPPTAEWWSRVIGSGPDWHSVE